MRRAIAAAPLALACLALAPVAQAGPIDGSSVTRSIGVDSGDSKLSTVTCRGGRFALSGAVVSASGTITALTSRPSIRRNRWVFGLLNAPDAGTRSARVVVRCGRIRLPRGTRRGTVGLATASSSNSAPVPAGGTARRNLSCPEGKQPTGWGFSRESGDVFPYRVAFGSRRLAIGVENAGSRSAAFTSYVRCIDRAVSVRGASDPRIRIRRRPASRTLSGGSERIRRSCRRRELSLATGFSVDPGRVDWLRSYPSRTRLGRYAFDGTGTARTVLLCLR